MTLEPKLTPEFAPYKRSWVVKAIPKGEEKPVYSKFAQGLTAGDAMAFMQAFVSALPSYTDTAKPFIGIVSIECDAEKRHDHDLPDLKFIMEVATKSTPQSSDSGTIDAENVMVEVGPDGDVMSLPDNLEAMAASIDKSVKAQFSERDTKLTNLHEGMQELKNKTPTNTKAEIDAHNVIIDVGRDGKQTTLPNQLNDITASILKSVKDDLEKRDAEITALKKRIETLEKSKK